MTNLVSMCCSTAKIITTQWQSLTIRKIFLRKLSEIFSNSKKSFLTGTWCSKTLANSLKIYLTVSSIFKTSLMAIRMLTQKSVTCWTKLWVSSRAKICYFLKRWYTPTSRTRWWQIICLNCRWLKSTWQRKLTTFSPCHSTNTSFIKTQNSLLNKISATNYNPQTAVRSRARKSEITQSLCLKTDISLPSNTFNPPKWFSRNMIEKLCAKEKLFLKLLQTYNTLSRNAQRSRK